MKTIIFTLLGIFLWSHHSKGQQQEHYSMYMQNNFLVNPAEGGTEDFIDAKIGHRSQWVDFGNNAQGGPRTFMLSCHSPINKRDAFKHVAFHGIGGVLTVDAIGPFDILTAKAAYAYHLPVVKDLVLSMGVFAGLKQYRINGSSLESSSDPTVVDPFVSNFQNAIVPDLTLGIWGYADNYYFGFASFQLIKADVDIYADLQTQQSSLTPHHWATAGYKVSISRDWFVVPSIVAKYVKSAPFTFDLNAKLRYQDMYWLGVSYRKEDAFVLLAGLTVKKKVDVGYSFDVTSTDIKNYTTGTHEFVLGYRFASHTGSPPPQFW